MNRCLSLIAILSAACSGAVPDTRPKLPDGGAVCDYVAPDARACCNGGSGCAGGLWCNTNSCACEDVVTPCANTGHPPPAGDAGTPDPGNVPAGSIGLDGGSVDKLWFATTGDTRPGSCDATDQYPKETFARIAQSMKALKVQFALDLGDHMFVCNGSVPEAQQQMGYYMAGVAQGPSPFFMTMGNHECGSYSCLPGSTDANFTTYLVALNRHLPWYSFDVHTAQGLARFVIIADDSWNAEQSAWLESTLADADRKARYTIVSRHHPVTGSRSGSPELVATIERHRYSLILTAHDHSYSHGTDHGGRAAIIGIGGAGYNAPGFGTILQGDDGKLNFVLRDANGNPTGTPWSVPPQ